MPILLALLGCQPDDAVAVPWCREIGDYGEILAQLDLVMARGSVPGAQLSIVDGGALACVEAVGQRGRDDASPVDRETRFDFGSISKSIASTAAISLEADGRIDLDGPITDLFDLTLEPVDDPDRSDPSAITMRQALSHTAGFSDTFDGESCDDADLEAYAAAAKRLDTPPGLAWHYSNPGYSVAAQAMVEADGRPWEKIVDRRVFRPLGMDRATYDPGVVLDDGDYATGLFDEGEGLTDQPPGKWACPGWVPAAGVWGTAGDLGHLVEGLLAGDGPFADGGAAELIGPYADTMDFPGDAYGLGVETLPYGDGEHVLYGHDGRFGGFLTSMAISPDDGFALIVLLDSDAQTPDPFAFDATGTYLGWGPWVRVADPADPETLADWTGTWTYDGASDLPGTFRTMDITEDRGHLYASKDGGPLLDVVPEATDIAWIPDGDDADGDLSALYRDEDGEPAWIVTRGWSAKRR